MTVATSRRPVPLCDLRAQYESIRDEIRRAVDEVLESQAFIMGPQVGELEARVADYCQCLYGVGCSSGTDALLLSLMALGVGPGDEVITTPFTFFATVGAISRLGARPVFVDIEPDGYNLDPARLEAALSPRTRAVIPVHLFGQTAEMGPTLEFARRHGLAVIEDAAQAIGAEYHSKRAGSLGDLGCLSFFPSKNLGGLGDGGMVVTNNPELAEKMRLLRTHGAAKKYYHTLVGGNFRLDTIHAAALLVKLRYLDQWTEARRRHAACYRELIGTSPAADHCELPPELPGRRHVYNQFIVRTPRRDRALEVFKAHKVGTAVYYPWPMHLQECFLDLGHREGDFPEAERACRETFALPMFPELTEDQQRAVVEVLAEALTD
jgi:dTDP-4-amino-4,6-dideoxygalactose transaminase